MSLKKFTEASFIIGIVLVFIPLFCYTVFPMPHSTDSIVLNSMCYMMIIGFVLLIISLVSFGVTIYLKFFHNVKNINIKMSDLDIKDKILALKNKDNNINLDDEIEYQRTLLYQIKMLYKNGIIDIMDCKRKTDIIQNRLETLIWLKQRKENK